MATRRDGRDPDEPDHRRDIGRGAHRHRRGPRGVHPGGSPFCAGGTILDSHASADLAVAKLGLVDRALTCADGTVRMVFTPEPPQGGSWRIVSGTDL